MAVQRSPIERLAQALLEAGNACHEIALQFRKTSEILTVPTKQPGAARQSGRIVPHFTFEYYRERHALGESLDQSLKDLQIRDWEITSDLNKSQISDSEKDTLLAERDELRQAMTDIQSFFLTDTDD